MADAASRITKALPVPLQLRMGDLAVSLGALVGAAGALLVVLGSLGPWASASASASSPFGQVSHSQTFNGIDGDGKITLLMALLGGAGLVVGALLPALRSRLWPAIAAAGPAVISLLIGGYAFVALSQGAARASGYRVSVSVSYGWGIFVVIAGSLVMILGAGLHGLGVLSAGRCGPRAGAGQPWHPQSQPQQPVPGPGHPGYQQALPQHLGQPSGPVPPTYGPQPGPAQPYGQQVPTGPYPQQPLAQPYGQQLPTGGPQPGPAQPYGQVPQPGWMPQPEPGQGPTAPPQ